RPALLGIRVSCAWSEKIGYRTSLVPAQGRRVSPRDKHLLYKERYTIEGARKYLELRAKPERRPPEIKKDYAASVQGELFPNSPILDEIRRTLTEILKILR